MGGVIIWLMKKVGKPVAEFLDNRADVSIVHVHVLCVCARRCSDSNISGLRSYGESVITYTRINVQCAHPVES